MVWLSPGFRSQGDKKQLNPRYVFGQAVLIGGTEGLWGIRGVWAEWPQWSDEKLILGVLWRNSQRDFLFFVCLFLFRCEWWQLVCELHKVPWPGEDWARKIQPESTRQAVCPMRQLEDSTQQQEPLVWDKKRRCPRSRLKYQIKI